MKFYLGSEDPKRDDESDEEEAEHNGCVVGNDIYFYQDVDDESALWLIERLRKLERKLLIDMAKFDGYAPIIRLHIKSDGGDMFAGMSMMDEIARSRIPVHTIADGMCASAATFMLLGGTKRFMKPHAHLLIHQLATGMFWGKFEELKDEVKTCKKFMSMIKDVYKEKTKIPKEKFNSMMKKDIYLTLEECLEYGIVHKRF